MAARASRGASGTRPARGLSNEELVEERFRGIRPAFGYPACPDHSREGEALRPARRGRRRDRADGELRDDSRPRRSAASTSRHPEARYFSVGRIGARPGRGLRRPQGRPARRGRALARAEPLADYAPGIPVPSRPAGARYPGRCGRLRAPFLPHEDDAEERRRPWRAGPNGNGRAVFPPAPSRADHAATAQPDAPPRRRCGLARRADRSSGSARGAHARRRGLAGGAYLCVEQTSPQSRRSTTDVKDAAEEARRRRRPARRRSRSSIGYDQRAGIEARRPSPLRHDDARPRRPAREDDLDALVPARPARRRSTACKHRRPWRTRRINDAYSACGSTGAIETVRQLTGLPINYLDHGQLPRLQAGRRQARRRLDGRRPPLLQRHGPAPSYAAIDLQPGYQKLNGRAGARLRPLPAHRLRPLPHRAPAGVREGRQAAGAAELPRRSTLPQPRQRRSRTTSRSAQGDGTRFDAKAILDYALFAYEPAGGHFFQPKIDTAATRATSSSTRRRVVRCRPPCNDFGNPDVEAPQKATDVALRRKRADNAPPPSRRASTVLNGNGVGGRPRTPARCSRSAATRSLTGERRRTRRARTTSSTEVYYRRAQPKAPPRRGRSRSSSATPTSSRFHRRSAPLANDALVTVVVGQTFHGSIAPPPPTGRRARTPPNVRHDTCAPSRSSRRRAKQRALPAARADGARARRSRLDADDSRSRVYRLDDGTRPSGSRLPHRRERLLGHPEDRLDGRAGPRRPERLDHVISGRDVRPLLHRLEAAHGRAAARTARRTGSSTRCSTSSRTRRCSRSRRA